MGPKPKPERNARIRKKVKGGMSWEEVAKRRGRIKANFLSGNAQRHSHRAPEERTDAEA